jgi:hypothetical protein
MFVAAGAIGSGCGDAFMCAEPESPPLLLPLPFAFLPGMFTFIAPGAPTGTAD